MTELLSPQNIILDAFGLDFCEHQIYCGTFYFTMLYSEYIVSRYICLYPNTQVQCCTCSIHQN